MAVGYIDPAERAWTRTRRILLQPFDVEKWIVIGFSAFLAALAGQWAGLSMSPRRGFHRYTDVDGLLREPFRLFDLFRDSYGFSFGAASTLFGLLIGVALLWLSSRGKFLFLENMIQGRGAIVEPWKRYGRLGDSLFLWRLGFYLAVAVAFGLLISPLALLGRELDDGSFLRPFGVLVTLVGGAISLVLGAAAAYVALFLESFVVPLMYKREVPATEAWRLFLPLLRRHVPEFLAYGLLILVACVAVALCLLAGSVVTCCVLPALLAVPYVRDVLLLPLSGLFRLYTLEFLEQFGPEYAVLSPAPSASATQPPQDPPEAL